MKATNLGEATASFDKLERNAVYPRVEQHSKQLRFFEEGLTKQITDTAMQTIAASIKEH